MVLQTTKRPLTAGTLFKNSMLALMKTLHSKEPFYVWCIKPNEAKSPVLFDRKRVEHQVGLFVELVVEMLIHCRFPRWLI